MNRRFLAAAAVAFGALSLATSSFAQAPQAGRGGPAVQPPVTATGTPGAVIRLKDGPVRGVVNSGVTTYLGIPFAAPPVGDLRWRSPRPAAKWTAVRDANTAGPGCATQEDCLYINVYTPANAKPGAKLPVMVWIYGGAFTGGNSTGGFGAVHDGKEFAKQDVITVTFNYRLGRYGWFAHPALTKEGETANFGMADQIAALKWVQANVGQFGGNTKNVTIFGESAGAISVLYLMQTPSAQGLFHKAISESGFARGLPTPLKDAEAYAAAAATKAGVTGDSAATAAALRKLPISAFPASTGLTDTTRPYPTLDGKLIRQTIAEGFAQGKQAKIPLIIGGNSNEASLFRPQAAGWAAVTDRRPQLMAAYNPNNNLSDLQLINDLTTVQRITEPDRYAARQHSKAGAPAYIFYFSYLTPSQRATSLGAAHTAEIPYVFNVLNNPGPQDVSTGQSMNAYWAAFAKYGNPGAAGGPTWPKYDAATDPWMVFSNNGSNVVMNHQKAKLDYVEAGIK